MMEDLVFDNKNIDVYVFKTLVTTDKKTKKDEYSISVLKGSIPM